MSRQINLALLKVRKLFRTYIVLFCLLLTACETVEPSTEEKTPATPVTTSFPTLRDIPIYVEAVGILEPSYSVDVHPQVSGMIEKLCISEGEWVKAGSPLFQIESKAYEIKVKEAEAQKLIDQATYEAAIKKCQRYQNLARKDLVAQVEWDELEAQVAQMKAILMADDARLEAAKLDLEKCTVKAPGNGRIGKCDVDLGSLVPREEPLTSISRMDPLMVNFALTEMDFAKLPKGPLTLKVELLCGAECSGEGKVTFLDNRFNAKSGLIFMRGELQNPDQHLLPGQSVKIRVPVGINPQRIMIAQKAIKYNQQGPYVYSVSPESTLQFRQLVLGEEEGDEVAVLEGIASNEAVVTSCPSRLSPGLKVEIQP